MVLVEQPSEHASAMNWPLKWRLATTWTGRRQHQRSMRSVPVVVLGILAQDRAEMTFTDNQQAVGALWIMSATRPPPHPATIS